MNKHNGEDVKAQSQKIKKFRYVGITDAAGDLGVSIYHLWAVLSGLRRSPRIEASDFYKQTTAARRKYETQKTKGHEHDTTV